ncbi:MAG TPA: hypothetical protein VFS37_14180 [Conexibacter sp.]|nr:hypothetical protein [Conexibacter sp.]
MITALSVPLADERPTAVQAVEAVHETPYSLVSDAPEMFGEDLTLQLDPFHPTVSVCVVPPLTKLPTAMQALEEVHETSVSSPAVAPTGSGTVRTGASKNSMRAAYGLSVPSAVVL